jgi:uncharacterized protein (DUF305 family)
MKKQQIIAGAIILILAAGVYYVATAKNRKAIGTMMTYEETAPENTSMGDGAGHAGHTTQTASDQSFLEHMIPHHQEAVDTAKQVLARGATTPEIKTLAENIVASQEKEVTDMKRWYKTWYKKEYVAQGYTPMMRDLSTLSGKDLDRAFLEDMIEHHLAALTKTQEAAAFLQQAETKELSKVIAETQSNEVVTMRTILKQL